MLRTRPRKHVLDCYGYKNDWVGVEADRQPFIPKDGAEGYKLLVQAQQPRIGVVDTYIEFDDNVTVNIYFARTQELPRAEYNVARHVRNLNGDMYLLTNHYLSRIAAEVMK